MTKFTPTPIVSLANDASGTAGINLNLSAISAALENTLSRDGTSPNPMLTTFDMNNQQIINLPVPSTANSPLRLQDLTSFVGTGPTGPSFVYVGDSLTDITGVGTWPVNLAASYAFFNRGHSYNYAISGQTAATMVGLYASQPGALNVTGEAYLFTWSGRNDVVVLTAAATIYSSLLTEWAAGRTSGYKVIAFTIMPGLGDTAAQNNIRVALNALIRGDTTKYDYLIDTDQFFFDPTDLSLRTSTGHLSPTGNSFLAGRVAAKLLGVESIPAQPVDTYDINMALNPAMDIDQRNAGAAVTGLTAGATAYITDGYSVRTAGTSIVTAQQVADAPPGLSKSLKITVTTAEASLAAGSFVWIRHVVEGYEVARLIPGATNSRPLSVGFFVKAHRPGNYSASILKGAGNSAYPFVVTVNNADTWEWKSYIIPGDVAAAWAAATTGPGLYLFITMAAGNNFLSSANAWDGTGGGLGAVGTINGVAATTDTFQVTGVLIVPAYHNLLAERIPRLIRPAPQELLKCQRRFTSDFPLGTAPANNVQKNVSVGVSYQTNAWRGQRFQFRSQMRIAPTITPYAANTTVGGGNGAAGQWQFFNAAGAWVDDTATGGTSITADGFSMEGTNSAMVNTGGWMVAGSWKAEADY